MGILQARHQYGLQEFRGSYTSAQTGTVIGTSSNAQLSIVVDKIVFSADVAGFLRISSGAGAASNAIGPGFYGGAQGGMALDEPYIKASAGAGMYFSTTHSGSHVLWVLYHYAGHGG